MSKGEICNLTSLSLEALQGSHVRILLELSRQVHGLLYKVYLDQEGSGG